MSTSTTAAPTPAPSTPKTWKLDASEFDPTNDDRAKIGNNTAVPCRLCFDMLREVNFTVRYCQTCGKGFCQSRHGTFVMTRTGGSVGRCCLCGDRARRQ